MITFTSLGGPTVKCTDGKKTIVVFPEKADSKSTAIFLLGEPQDEPTKTMISWPGEYDLDGIAVHGIGHDGGDSVSFVMEVDGIRSAFVVSPLHDWTDHEIELLGDVDVLFIPTDNAKTVQKMVDEVDPRILVPLPTSDAKTFDEVLSVSGAQGKEKEDELKLKGRSGLPSEGRNVVVLKGKK